MKNLCRSTGGSCKCLQKSTWRRGVQKVKKKLVYVVYGWRLIVKKTFKNATKTTEIKGFAIVFLLKKPLVLVLINAVNSPISLG